MLTIAAHVKIDINNEEEKITSCVIVSDEDIEEKISYSSLLKGKNQKIIFEALNNILRSSKYFGQASASMDKPCIELADAIESTKNYLACKSKRQTERTQDAIQGLVNSGLLKHESGWLWMA